MKAIKRILFFIVVALVFFIPFVLLVQVIEATFWIPNDYQLDRMKVEANLCFHNADCREKTVHFVDCQWSQDNKYNGDLDISYDVQQATLDCLPIEIPLCRDNACTSKILGIF